MAIDSSVRVYKSDEICVKSEGLMGERVISITPKPLPEGADLHLVGPEDIVFATPSASAEEMLKEITVTAQKTDQAIDSLFRASEQLTSLLTSLNNGHFAEKLVRISEKTIATLDSVDVLTDSLTKGIQGRGTVGKLIKDPTLYDTLLECSNRTQQLLTDITTYGFLFHTNRDWQREMNRRTDEQAALLASSLPLSTRERFEKIAHIMSELQLSLEQAAHTLDRGSLRKDDALREEFSKGLSNVELQLENLAEAVHEATLDGADETNHGGNDKSI